MEISRKAFLRELTTGTIATSAWRMGLLPTLASENLNPPEIIEGQEVRRAIPLAAATERVNGGAIFVNHGSGFGRRIAYTFDDGPTEKDKVTERVLATLKERNIKATFFMIGGNVAAHPDLARAVVEDGHEVGNHSLTHPFLNRLSNERVTYELEKTQDFIAIAVGYKPIWFRPPFGAFKRSQGGLASALGLGVVY